MKTIEFLKAYILALGFSEGEYVIEDKQDTMGYLINLTVSSNHPSVGCLVGKKKSNLILLKKILRVVGATERINPCLKLLITSSSPK